MVVPTLYPGVSRAVFSGVPGARHDHPDRGHDTRPAGPLRALHDLAFGVPQLSRPTRSVDGDRAHAVADRTHLRVPVEGVADDLRPGAGERLERVRGRHSELPAERRDRVTKAHGLAGF